MDDSVTGFQPLRIGLLLLVLALGLAGCAVTSQERRLAEEGATKEERAGAEDVYTDNHIHEYHNFPCGPADKVWAPQPSNDYLSWTPDGEHIVFAYFKEDFGFPEEVSSLYIVDAHGTRLRLVVDAHPLAEYYGMPYGLHADIAPDGARIVYTSCEFPNADRRSDAGSKFRRDAATRFPSAAFNYEIAVINVDGTEQQRLTENTYLDQFPVWSPDGSRIAYIADFTVERPIHISRTNTGALYTMAADGTDIRRLGPPGVRDVALALPLWSPDGEYLAFTTRNNVSLILNTIRADGAGERTRIGRVLDTPTRPLQYMPPPVPSWSPDGELLAFAAAAEENDSSTVSTVYTIRPDGSEQRKLLDVRGNVSHVLWSPSGEYLAILAWIWNDGVDSAYYLYVVRPDGTELGHHSWAQYRQPWNYLPPISWSPTRAELLVNDEARVQAFFIQIDDGELHTRNLQFVRGSALAAWSPDGERIAFFTPHTIYPGDNVFWTIARDGTDRRDIVNIDEDGKLVPANLPQDGA